MEQILDFLRRLRENNNREWFDSNRAEWAEVKERFGAFTQQLIESISSFDNSTAGLRVQDCTYRINRDTRFSADKSPYKSYVSAFIAPRGKKSGFAGYYFHIEPSGGDMIGQSLLASGVYCPEPVVLRSIREEVADNGAELTATIESAKGFVLDQDAKLKRLPRGFESSPQYEELLKLKNFGLNKYLSDDDICAPNLLERAVADFKLTQPFVEQLNRAIRYAYEEMR